MYLPKDKTKSCLWLTRLSFIQYKINIVNNRYIITNKHKEIKSILVYSLKNNSILPNIGKALPPIKLNTFNNKTPNSSTLKSHFNQLGILSISLEKIKNNPLLLVLTSVLTGGIDGTDSIVKIGVGASNNVFLSKIPKNKMLIK